MVNDLLNNYSTILKYEDIEYLNLFLNYKRNIIKKLRSFLILKQNLQIKRD